ncbi:hypothetical protein Q9L58_003192 [Maublancomyces gigas]|uniref:Swiss Army Knife RNA repair protein HAD domain-containing protein n=1 Tax=Discina gigas TaxID=1032678 RepID=A0ABR3GPG1_9PEZI
MSHGSPMVGFSRTSDHSPTSLARWSILNQPLPARETIKTVHIYDFDNTLFMTPLPNSKIWTSPTLGFLQQIECLANGGWWHDSRFLAATGKGLEIEEGRAWEGWWNEKIVSLVELSAKQKNALTILLTGRSVKGYSGLIQRMIGSKNLDFEVVALKPEAGPNSEHLRSTILFKCMFLEDVLNTYTDVEEIRVYEDRVKHVKSFEDFFVQYNASSLARNPGRKPPVAEVIQVAEAAKCLDPTTELLVMQKVIFDHNTTLEQRLGSNFTPLQIKKTVFYTGYLLTPSTTSHLLKTLPIPNDNGLKLLGNSILITTRPASPQILSKVGGLGNKVDWDVIGWGQWENKVWAAIVKPANPDVAIYTETNQPMIVLALRGRDTRPMDAHRIKNWQALPSGQSLRITTVVGEKLLLRIEENSPEGE